MPEPALYLVRHSLPAMDPATDPAAWELGAGGRRSAQRLREHLPASAMLVASPEAQGLANPLYNRERASPRSPSPGSESD
jgi:hypothetical protein